MIYTDIDRYKRLFVGFKSRPSMFIEDTHSWVALKKSNFVTRGLLRKHLNREMTIGQFLSADPKRFAVLDFDYSKEKYFNSARFNEFISGVTSLFNCPKLLIQSSKSLGMHCWLFFKYACPAAIQFRIESLLNQEGYELSSGTLELFCSKNQNIRLPFGQCSYIINDRLEIETKNVHELLELSYARVGEYKNLPTIYKATDKLKSGKTMVFIYEKKTNNLYIEEAEKLLQDGLTERGTMNDSCITVAIYFCKKGLDEERALEELDRWAFTKHNNLSKDVLQPERFRVKLRGIVTSVYTNENNNSKLLEIKVETNLCMFIHNQELKYKDKLRLFNFFQFLKRGAVMKSTILIAKNFLIHYLGMNSSNYKKLLRIVNDAGYIKLLNKGNNLKKHASFYEWTGGKLDFELGHLSFEQFLIENNLFSSYNHRVINKIEERVFSNVST